MNRDLTTWSSGERLWLWRLVRGLNRDAAARVLGVNHSYLSQMERDRRPAVRPRGRVVPSTAALCRLARRRNGVSTAVLAEALGVSRATLHKWERAGDPRLRRWWEISGYTFR